MFPAVEAIVLAINNTGFLINSGHKIAAAIVSDLGGAAFVAVGGMRLRHYDTNDGGVGEGWRRTS